MILQNSKWLNDVFYDNGSTCVGTRGVPEYINTVNHYIGRLPKNAFVKVFSYEKSDTSNPIALKTLPNDRCQSGQMTCSDDQRPLTYDPGVDLMSGYCRCN